MKNTCAVNDRFEEFFSGIYGERWETLRAALLNEETKVARECFFQAISPVAYGKQIYNMCPASIIAAQTLGVLPGEKILDMCSAPGGKGLILVEALEGKGEIILNEPSAARRGRLKKVIQEYVPSAYLSGISISGRRGEEYGIKLPNYFDRILVDAPCSGERHLIKDAKYMREWSKKRTERLAKQQYALLTSALLALRPGGVMVYSTCSISPLENDGVIERLLERKEESVRLDAIALSGGKSEEATKYGYLFLPDRSGWGPLYISRLKKKSIGV